MPTITDSAVCIRRWDFSETSQTVSLFTREHGIIRGLAKGAKREKGNFSGGLDVLTGGRIIAIIKPGRDLATLTDWHLEETYRALRQRLDANRAGLYMADLIHHLLTDHDPHPRLFDTFTACLVELSETANVEPILLRFQWSILEEAGYRPELDRDAKTGGDLTPSTRTLAFSAAAGGVVTDTGAADRWRVRRETIDVLREVAAGSIPPTVEPDAIKRANRLLAVYLRELIGSEPPAMRWAFSDLRTS
jgi:DNA repair protein RecO (recombination protein O)